MQNIYYIVFIVSCSVFLIQCISSWFGGDADLNVYSDLTIGDLVSFKGILHFILGCSSWLCITDKLSAVQWYDYLIAIVIGIIFMVILYYSYKLMLKLNHYPTQQSYLSKTATVYLPYIDDYYYLLIGGSKQVLARSISGKRKIGEIVKIVDYRDGIYYF